MAGPSFERGFEFVEHTADIAARLRGRSVAEVFQAAALAFTQALTDRRSVASTATRQVELAAPELDLLLVDWLEELLFLFETEGFLVREADVTIADALASPVITATLHGETRDPGRHPLKLLIKAVTYHGLHIAQTGQGYEATVIFDI